MSILYNASIIIPHYTKSNTVLLQRAVESIPIDDTIQVLVVDNSPIRINENLFAERSNVHIVFSDNTKGAGHARNIGINKSNGKWLLFLDADDFFVKDAFDTFNSYYNSKADIIFFNMTSCFSDTLEKAARHKPFNEIIDNYFISKNEYHLRCSYPSPCGKMVRAKFVKDNEIYFDEIPASNDVIFALRIGLQAKSIRVDKKTVYCATVQKGSLTNTISLQNIENRFEVSLRKNKLLKKNGYKKDASVLYYILSSSRFGFIPFIRLFFKALKSGDLFVGYRRWVKTFIKKSYLQDRDYKVKK